MLQILAPLSVCVTQWRKVTMDEFPLFWPLLHFHCLCELIFTCLSLSFLLWREIIEIEANLTPHNYSKHTHYVSQTVFFFLLTSLHYRPEDCSLCTLHFFPFCLRFRSPFGRSRLANTFFAPHCSLLWASSTPPLHPGPPPPHHSTLPSALPTADSSLCPHCHCVASKHTCSFTVR